MEAAIVDLIASSEAKKRHSLLSDEESIAMGRSLLQDPVLSTSDLRKLHPEVNISRLSLIELAHDLPVILVGSSTEKTLVVALEQMQKDSQLLAAILSLNDDVENDEGPTTWELDPDSAHADIDLQPGDDDLQPGEVRTTFGPTRKLGRPSFSSMVPELVSVVSKFLASVGTGAHKRRRDDSGTVLGATLAQITKAVKDAIPGLEDCLASDKTVKYMMLPPHKGTRESKKYTSQIHARVPHNRNSRSTPNPEAHQNITQVVVHFFVVPARGISQFYP